MLLFFDVGKYRKRVNMVANLILMNKPIIILAIKNIRFTFYASSHVELSWFLHCKKRSPLPSKFEAHSDALKVSNKLMHARGWTHAYCTFKVTEVTWNLEGNLHFIFYSVYSLRQTFFRWRHCEVNFFSTWVGVGAN